MTPEDIADNAIGCYKVYLAALLVMIQCNKDTETFKVANAIAQRNEAKRLEYENKLLHIITD